MHGPPPHGIDGHGGLGQGGHRRLGPVHFTAHGLQPMPVIGLIWQGSPGLLDLPICRYWNRHINFDGQQLGSGFVMQHD